MTLLSPWRAVQCEPEGPTLLRPPQTPVALQPLSLWQGLASAARAAVVAVAVDVSDTAAAELTFPLDGELWRRHVDMSQAATHDTECGSPPAADDAAWEPVAVPDNYGLDARLERYWGPVWYACDVRVPGDAAGMDLDIVFDAVDYLADVWVDGVHMGRHEGPFSPFRVSLGRRGGRDGDVGDGDKGSDDGGDGGDGGRVSLLVRVQDPLETAPEAAVLPLLRKRCVVHCDLI